MASLVQQVLKQVEQDEVRFVALWFTDIAGGVKSIMIPVDQLATVIDQGMHFDGSAIEGSTRVAESDMLLVPDLGTYAVLPWTDGEGNTARLICSVYTQEGQPFLGDPRSKLIQVLGEIEELGYAFHTGVELEFFLFRTDDDGKPVLNHAHDYAGYYDIPDDWIREVRRAMLDTLVQLGVAVTATYSEIGYGQHEFFLPPRDALITADNILTARVAMKAVAQKYGLYCTFMPRPLKSMPGSGLHTLQSLHAIKDGSNIFTDANNQYSLSEIAQQFLAGQLIHARAMTAVLAPLVNSYKRLGTSFEAPVAVTWAHVNRHALIRVPRDSTSGEARLELRCPDPSVNPYLMMNVILSTGLDGIRNQLHLASPLEESLLTIRRPNTRSAEHYPVRLNMRLM